ncbi:helix-turn-helix transcriptional regulator [Kitasatospora sp. NPDC001603]|uniref:helix-turn-helix domain-containing protein n=1 Tax=Kitasatospora sp. NPDC001603 TaxID=3154388 RepID=UPI003319461E
MSVNILSAPEDLRGMLASCRDRVEVSQEKLAEMVGVSGRHYGDFERGKVPHPNPQLLERVAAVLQMSTTEKQSMYELVSGLQVA